jgi:hypothetical protein
MSEHGASRWFEHLGAKSPEIGIEGLTRVGRSPFPPSIGTGNMYQILTSASVSDRENNASRSDNIQSSRAAKNYMKNVPPL